MHVKPLKQYSAQLIWHYHSATAMPPLTLQLISKYKCASKVPRTHHLDRNTWGTPDVQHGPASSPGSNPLPSSRSGWGCQAHFSRKNNSLSSGSGEPCDGAHCPWSLLETQWLSTEGSWWRVPSALVTTQQRPDRAGVTERQPPVEPQHGSVFISVLPLGKLWYYYQLNPEKGVRGLGGQSAASLDLTVNFTQFLVSNRIRGIHAAHLPFHGVQTHMIPVWKWWPSFICVWCSTVLESAFSLTSRFHLHENTGSWIGETQGRGRAGQWRFRALPGEVSSKPILNGMTSARAAPTSQPLMLQNMTYQHIQRGLHSCRALR